MDELMTLEELVAATNAAIADVDVADGRVAEALTERNVRYYVTLGLVRPPVRDGGRSLWTRDHVNDLIRIRRAQSLGRSLKQIPPFRSVPGDGAWRLANVAAESRSELAAALFTRPVNNGWSLQISPTVVLSGFTDTQPTEAEVAEVRNALRRVLAG
jgi:hypothetical protein